MCGDRVATNASRPFTLSLIEQPIRPIYDHLEVSHVVTNLLPYA